MANDKTFRIVYGEGESPYEAAKVKGESWTVAPDGVLQVLNDQAGVIATFAAGKWLFIKQMGVGDG